MPTKDVNIFDRWWKVGTFVGIIAFSLIGAFFEVKQLSKDADYEKARRSERVKATDEKFDKKDKKDVSQDEMIIELKEEVAYLKGKFDAIKK